MRHRFLLQLQASDIAWGKPKALDAQRPPWKSIWGAVTTYMYMYMYISIYIYVYVGEHANVRVYWKICTCIDMFESVSQEIMADFS